MRYQTIIAIATIALFPSIAVAGPRPNVEISVTGAGQRDTTHTFGGNLRFAKGKSSGEFTLIVHPPIPRQRSIPVLAACRYREFQNVESPSAGIVTFRMRGNCLVTAGDGRVTASASVADVQITDIANSADAIDIRGIGQSGFGIPASRLSSGDFVINVESGATTSDPPKHPKDKDKGKGKGKGKGKNDKYKKGKNDKYKKGKNDKYKKGKNDKYKK